MRLSRTFWGLSKLRDIRSYVDRLTHYRWYLQVNCVFRDAVLASPLIQHKIDLFATGLEYNAAAGVSLADSKKSLLRYHSSLETLRPIEERVMNLEPRFERASGGTYAIAFVSSVRVFTLGSASRGIPHKEWEITPPVTHIWGYCFYPGADVIAFLDCEAMWVRSSQ